MLDPAASCETEDKNAIPKYPKRESRYPDRYSHAACLLAGL